MPKKIKFEIGDVKEAARGNWVDIFSRFNITVPKIDTHGPCPSCGGEDRFRYDDKYENGDYICNVCTESANRDGFDLIGKVTGMPFLQVIEEVAAIVGLDAKSKITPAMRKQWDEERKIRERIRQEVELKKQQQVARQAKGLYRNPYPGESSPYLERKQVPALSGIKIDHKGNVLVPAYDETGTMWNMQTIYPDGGKFFVSDEEDATGNKKGGRTGGCFFLIGTIELNNPIICIAEGYATGASIHIATGYPVVLSFVANNLPKVGAAIRAMYPMAQIVYCADDDSAKEDTGLKYAQQALAVTGGIIVLPRFNEVA
ncbi:DNA primase [Acinetobacter beijerinckii]|uniref:primase-helicase zinc-binding domain-containing protein n=1 Tax=Acinetobacter beijerinckii TaxID=262668 RepID=UPI0023DDE1C8|nr:primase-helicase zinc-binding domain-containing protein [Acinetobacter beijerinckii]MDF2418047.1 DNA primase [Acinetobacter beijerinckii]